MWKKIRRILIDNYKYTLANLNLRDGKSTSANIISVIPMGSKVEIIDAEEEWYKVSYNSQIGYVYKDYLSVTKINWANLSLRQDKSSSSDLITVIPQKTRLQVLDTDNDWSRVVYNNLVGYVFNYYLNDDGNRPNDYNYDYFYNNMNKFVNSNNIKSTTNYLLTTDLKNKYTYVFKKGSGVWNQIYKYQCTIGKPSTPTIVGTFHVNGRKPFFGTDEYLVKYATRIRGGYYYHSILYYPDGVTVKDDRLGMALSHGCIRMTTNNAKWIYENIQDTTTVIIY